MLTKWRLLPLLLLAAALLGGCLAADDSSDPSERQDSGRIPTVLADQGNSDAGDTGVDSTEVSEWGEWGTLGSIEGRGQSPDGHALCGLTDIRTDDIDGDYSTEVPDGTWGSSPIADRVSRCGDDDETTLWRLTNCERISRDIDPLACDLRLVWVSREHSADMIERDFWGHANPDGETPFDRMADRGITFYWAGENIANYFDLEQLHWGWMDSTAGHRDNILLGEFTHVGLGVIHDTWGYMATQDFIGL